MFTALKSQDVSIKKGLVYVNDVQILNCEGSEVKGYTFYTMDGEEVLFMILNGWQGNNYWKFTFVKENKVLFPSTLYTRKAIIEALVKNGILKEGKWNGEKLDVFISKYAISK
jgi:hypothetical protein